MKPIMKHLPLYLLLLVATAFYLGPFLFSLSISFSADQDVFSWPIRLLPENWTLDNYVRVWEEMPFARWLFNSSLISLVQTVSNVFFAALAGFAFARLDFPGKNVLFAILLGSLMIPGIILLVPKFILLNELKLINSYPGLILPGLVSVVNIFLMKQFFETIPRDLEDAARID
ncbi:MAG: carbohydrate ABC transporter permease, partial [Calditrichota bacterium]